MTTSSKTNMNEDLYREFENKFSRGSYWFFETDEGVEELLKWIQTAISKAKNEERERIIKVIGTEKDSVYGTGAVVGIYHDGQKEFGERIIRELKLLTQDK